MLYPLLRSALFRFDAEKTHNFALPALNSMLGGKAGEWYRRSVPDKPVQAFGLQFPNPIGLAAGLDKNGDYIDGLGNLGFGFIEIGTVTPRPQAGNPLPRLFRLPQHEALINRFGFNNKGVDHLVEQVKRRRYKGILGINIGKNKDTPNEAAIDDYLICLEKVYAHADYVTINISSPNTPGLRDLQHGEARRELFSALKQAQQRLADTHARHVPMLVKIAPDITLDEVNEFADDALAAKLEGIIATNTTNSRQGVEDSPNSSETGGLSGRPLTEKALAVHQQLGIRLAGSIPMIGVGGISSATDATASFNAGATLLQVYTGFIYQGPALIKELLRD